MPLRNRSSFREEKREEPQSGPPLWQTQSPFMLYEGLRILSIEIIAICFKSAINPFSAGRGRNCWSWHATFI